MRCRITYILKNTLSIWSGRQLSNQIVLMFAHSNLGHTLPISSIIVIDVQFTFVLLLQFLSDFKKTIVLGFGTVQLQLHTYVLKRLFSNILL